MRRLLTVSMAVAMLCACGDDVPRPAETARADEALVPVEDTVANVAPVEEAAPIVPAPAAPKPAKRAPRRAPVPEASPPSVATATPTPASPAEDSVVMPEPESPPADSISSAADPVPAAAADTPLPAPSDSVTPIPADTAPSTVPPPARAPDTVGTRRTIPAAPSPIVPDADTTASAAAAPSENPSAIPAGSELHAALLDSIHSRRDSAGMPVTARLMENVTGPDGRTLLPAGATVRLTVTRLEAAGSRAAADGRLELEVNDVTVNGETVQVAAEVRPIPHELRGRGVTGSEAAKVGAGAAAGAIAGRVLGGDTRGAVIGGVVGAAGGAAVARQTADRDVVVKAGTPITFVLTAPLVAPAP